MKVSREERKLMSKFKVGDRIYPKAEIRDYLLTEQQYPLECRTVVDVTEYGVEKDDGLFNVFEAVCREEDLSAYLDILVNRFQVRLGKIEMEKEKDSSIICKNASLCEDVDQGYSPPPTCLCPPRGKNCIKK